MPTIAATLALCVVLVLAGCAVSRPTKAQYIAKADAICQAASTQVAPLIERLASIARSLKPGGQTTAARELASALQQLHTGASSSLARLRALEQPTAGRTAIGRFLTPFATVVGALGQAQAAAGADKPRQALAELEQAAPASAQMTSAASAYGMTQCETVLTALSGTAATLVSAFAASEVHRAPPPPPTPTPTPELGSHGAAVLALQQQLERLSYLPVGVADGVFGEQTWHAVVAFQGWSEIERDGVVGPQTRAALAHAQRPTPWSTEEGMEVHIPQQVLLLVRGGQVWRAIHVSTGRPGWPTPEGHFEVIERDEESWSIPFEVWMPLAQYFYSGYAIHEFFEVPAYPYSHGCVRVPEPEAETVWNFGHIGMRVWTSP